MRENNAFRIIIINCFLHVRSPGPPRPGDPQPQGHGKSLQEMPGSVTKVVMLTAAAILGAAPGSSGALCLLNHVNLTGPCEVDTNIIPILSMGKLRPRGADLLKAAQPEGATPLPLGLKAVFWPICGYISTQERREEGRGRAQPVTHLQDLALPEGELLFPGVWVR